MFGALTSCLIPPGGDSPIGGGCLSAGREGTRPGSWFPVPPLPGEFVRKPGLSFHPLPPCFRFAPEPVSQRFPGVLVSGGRVLSFSIVNVRRGARYGAAYPGTPPRFTPGAVPGWYPRRRYPIMKGVPPSTSFFVFQLFFVYNLNIRTGEGVLFS